METMFVLDYNVIDKKIVCTEIYIDYTPKKTKAYNLDKWMDGEKDKVYGLDKKVFYSDIYLDACLELL